MALVTSAEALRLLDAAKFPRYKFRCLRPGSTTVVEWHVYGRQPSEAQLRAQARALMPTHSATFIEFFGYIGDDIGFFIGSINTEGDVR